MGYNRGVKFLSGVIIFISRVLEELSFFFKVINFIFRVLVENPRLVLLARQCIKVGTVALVEL